jgi:hypothetical protein
MEGLRQISQTTFSQCTRMTGIRYVTDHLIDDAQKFNRVGRSQTYDTLVLSQHSTESPKVTRGYLVETELTSWTASSDTTVEATLKLICLTSEPNTSLNISRDIFSTMLLNIQADPSMLYMICHVKDGFHFFPGSTESNSHLLPTWFVGTSRYAVLWTFDCSKSTTMGIVIERQRNAFKGLTDVLEKFTKYIHAPHVMCFGITLYQVHFYDARTEAALNDMRVIERAIGFGPRKGPGHWHGEKPAPGAGRATFAIDEIFAHSQKVHEVAGKIKNSDRLRRSSARMLEDVLAANRAAGQASGEKYKRALEQLSEAVPVLQRQMDANKDYLEYMQYRAENLSQVIIALLTHEDASATIDLAAESRKDTSSMKAIAVMSKL